MKQPATAHLVVIATLLSIARPAPAGPPPGMPGELVVYVNTGLAGPQMGPGDVYTNRFSATVVPPVKSYALAGNGDGIALTSGKHLVLYNTRNDQAGSGSRANIRAGLSLVSGGTTQELAYGWSHGYIRASDGADETVLSGGTIVDAGGGGTLRLVTHRTDSNTGRLTVAVADQTAIQLLKLDDNLDMLRLSRSNDTAAATDTYTDVTYDLVDENSAGAMTFTNGQGSITLNDAGHYLVMANTTVDRTGLSETGTRISYTQRLLLDGVEVTGSKTTTYLRGQVDDDGCLDGVAALGMIVEAAAGQTLQVQLKQEGTQAANIVGARSGLVVAKLPDTGQFIKLEDTTGQDLNPAARTPVTFTATNGTPDAVFSHAATSSVVTVNRDGRFLFLGAFYCDQDQVERQCVNQQWAVNGTPTEYGQSSRYSRNDLVFDNGNWSAVVVDLRADDEMEMTSARLAADGVLPGESVGLQGVSVLSLVTNPVILTNERLAVVAGETEIVGGDLLLSADSVTAASNLTYTVNSTPTGGTLRVEATVLGIDDTFTQADIDTGKLSFEAGLTPGEDHGFAFTVSDEGGASASDRFSIKVAAKIVTAGDSGATDEDTAATTLTNGVTTVLDNDTGEALTVTAYDPLSTLGATVVVNTNGTFSYDPTAIVALQQLGTGDTTNDTFTYTVTDAIGETATATVTIAVSGIEDGFAAVDNHVDDPTNTVYEDAAASITVDLTANDGIVRTANGTTNDILVLNYDAAAADAATRRWKNLGSLGGATMDWHLGTGIALNSVTSARAGISAACVWSGSSAAVLNSGGAASISSILGDGTIDKSSASFEFWVKPSAATLAHNSTLFETGGGSGVGIVIGSNGLLRAANNILVGEVTYDLAADSLGLVGGDPTAEFFQVVFVSNFDDDLSSLYVNGTLVDTAANTATDWCGGDEAGLGRFQGSNHGGFLNSAANTEYDTCFNGELAVFRVYNEALSPAEVFQNFQAIDQGGIDMEGDALTLSGIYDTNTNLVPGTGTEITLASGGKVTLDSNTGSFTYDPTGIAGIADLADGETLTDTFDIQVTDGNGQTDDATVSVAIHGWNSAADDSLQARELFVTTFEAGELVGNDEHSAEAGGAYIDLDAGDVTASNLADSVWVNAGYGGATYNGTIDRGTLVDPGSGFGAISAAWKDPVVAVASLDPISTADGTCEIWFKPSFADGGQQALFESGGSGNGMSIVYDADNRRVVCTLDCGVDDDPDVQLEATAAGIGFDEFNQLVMVYDKNNPVVEDSLTLYLNNDPAAGFDATPDAAITNTAGGADDWVGTDDGGIGTQNDAAALARTLNDFQGCIAILRVYERALAVSEIRANFDATVQSIAALTPAAPITTDLGATVTLNADGSVSYDATSLSTNIPAGGTALDTFSYTIEDGIGGTSTGTVTVTVTGVGSFYAVDDSVAVGEDGPAATFDPRTNDVGGAGGTIELQTVIAGYRADFQAGTNQSQLADFSSTTGWRYMWNAPTDWDGSNSLDATTGPLGVAADYRLLKWHDGANSRWCADGDNDNLNGKPGNYVRLTDIGGHPGRGATQDEGITNSLDRAAIAAYTVSETGCYAIADSYLTRIAAGDTIAATVYVEDSLIGSVTLGGGVTGSFDMKLGQVNAGESIYVAAVPDGHDGSDSFQWDFTILKLPDAGSEQLATRGTVTTDGNTITYDPDGQFELLPVGGSTFETFQYTLRDGSNVSHATVTVEVQGVNDAPTAVADVANTDEDNTVAGSVIANDVDTDQGDTLLGFTVTAVQGAPGNVGTATATDSGGSVTLQADGSYVYDPDGQFEGLNVGDTDSDTFTYLIRDAHGLSAPAAATVTVTIAGMDDGVIATDNDYELPADATVAGNLITDDTGNGVDVSIDANDLLFIQSVNASNVQGILTISAPSFMGTRGTITNLTDAVQTVSFGAGRFSNAVVFANPPSDNETEPTVVVVSNVNATAGTFDIRLKEQPETGGATNDMDGAAHAAESVSWFVLEAGQYRLANGALMEVGAVDSAATRPQSWQQVNFTAPFTTNPVVFNQVQTFSGNTNEKTELFGTRMSGPATTNGFEVALEEYAGATAPRVTPETIGWLAIEPCATVWNGNLTVAGITPEAVDQNMYAIAFGVDFGTAPHFIASQATVKGSDPAQLRFRNLDNDSVQVKVAEDTFGDTETGHIKEQVTYLAVAGSGDLTAYPASVPIGGFVYDPNGVFDRLPYKQTATETFTYTLTDEHGNTDTKTVTITVTDIQRGMLIMVK